MTDRMKMTLMSVQILKDCASLVGLALGLLAAVALEVVGLLVAVAVALAVVELLVAVALEVVELLAGPVPF